MLSQVMKRLCVVWTGRPDAREKHSQRDGRQRLAHLGLRHHRVQVDIAAGLETGRNSRNAASWAGVTANP